MALQALDLVVSLIFLTTLFAMIYKWMPRVKVAWRDVFFGAGITALLFALGKTAIGTYIGTTGIASAFGAAASLVVMLLWVYWSAQIFLLCREPQKRTTASDSSCLRIGFELRCAPRRPVQVSSSRSELRPSAPEGRTDNQREHEQDHEDQEQQEEPSG